MKRSANELAGIVCKAAMGAGIPVGQADELALTALYLALNGAALDPVVDALQESQEAVDVAWGGERLVIKSGHAALVCPIVKDGFATGITKVKMAKAGHLPLLIAMLAEAGLKAEVSGTIVTVTKAASMRQAKGPVEVQDGIWDFFETFAARTYVPDTRQSRTGGAGAGLTDND